MDDKILSFTGGAIQWPPDQRQMYCLPGPQAEP